MPKPSPKTASPSTRTVRVVGFAPTLEITAAEPLYSWFPLTTDGFASWVSLTQFAGDQTVGPTAGTLRLSGQVPLVGSETTAGVIDGGGEISESVDANFAVVYDLLGTVEQTFTILYQMVWFAYPTVGTLRVTGQAPTVSRTQNQWVSPAVGSLTLGGQIPAVTRSGNTAISPSAGTVLLAGQQPTVEKGAKEITPEAGVLRFAGRVPAIVATPVYVYPFTVSLQIVGQQPTVISPFYVTPGTATLRIQGMGIIAQTFTATYQLLSATASQEFVARYTISGSVSTTATAVWNIESRVCALRVRSTQRRITAAPAQRRFVARPSQRTIRVKACANQ